MTVYCINEACIYCKNQECTKDYICIDFDGCQDYEIEPEEKYSEVYYILKAERHGSKEVFKHWQKVLGKKEIISGREVYRTGERYTDAITGAYIGNNKDEIEKRITEWREEFEKLVAENGLSPLYEENLKYPVTEI